MRDQSRLQVQLCKQGFASEAHKFQRNLAFASNRLIYPLQKILYPSEPRPPAVFVHNRILMVLEILLPSQPIGHHPMMAIFNLVRPIFATSYCNGGQPVLSGNSNLHGNNLSDVSQLPLRNPNVFDLHDSDPPSRSKGRDRRGSNYWLASR